MKQNILKPVSPWVLVKLFPSISVFNGTMIKYIISKILYSSLSKSSRENNHKKLSSNIEQILQTIKNN